MFGSGFLVHLEVLFERFVELLGQVIFFDVAFWTDKADVRSSSSG